MTTDGDRYLVVNGRRWRRTNPNLPEAERVRLVRKLMAARRLVKHALRIGNDRMLRKARRQVHAAKVGLGERGRPWWLP